MSSTGSQRRRGPRRVLSEDEILDAALSLLDQGGTDAVSVRGIANAVGLAPNAIYTYFPNKAALMAALAERLLGEVDHGVLESRDLPWRQRAEAFALELRAHLTAHPGAVELIVASPLNGPHALALNEMLLELFAEAGLDPDTAARGAFVLVVYILGAMVREVAGLRDTSSEPSERRRIAARLRTLAETPPDRYPRTAAAADAIADRISTDHYLWGLHRVLDGITVPPTEAPGRV